MSRLLSFRTHRTVRILLKPLSSHFMIVCRLFIRLQITKSDILGTMTLLSTDCQCYLVSIDICCDNFQFLIFWHTCIPSWLSLAPALAQPVSVLLSSLSRYTKTSFMFCDHFCGVIWQINTIFVPFYLDLIYSLRRNAPYCFWSLDHVTCQTLKSPLNYRLITE